MAPAFAQSSDFAIDKPAGRPCPNLLGDNSCGIHGSLRQRGFGGCVTFDCFGAGQQVTQVTFGRQDWRSGGQLATGMFTAFGVMRQLHEFRWYLTEAANWTLPAALTKDLASTLSAVEQLTTITAGELDGIDLSALGGRVGDLLGRASTRIRARHPRAADHQRADLVGANLRGADLRGASFRGSYLLGADLRDADLTDADLLGADLRGAQLDGALVAPALFVTQPQLEAATGDAATTIPPDLRRPAHWAS